MLPRWPSCHPSAAHAASCHPSATSHRAPSGAHEANAHCEGLTLHPGMFRVIGGIASRVADVQGDGDAPQDPRGH